MMAIWKWLNRKRIRDYPRLIFISSWIVLILNLLLHKGWTGGLTGIMIGGDFISNYSGGSMYLTDISRLYDPEAQAVNQASLVAPYVSPGFAPFISPPYVALAASWISFVPIVYAFIGWEILNILCVLLSVTLLCKYIIPAGHIDQELSPFQLSIIILSSFAFVVGFMAGQSHGFTLLLCVGIILAMMKEKWVVAGLLGSFLTYKPQFVIGFLICWVAWGKIKPLLSFSILTVLWQIPIILSHGFTPYLEYLKFSKSLLYLPYANNSFPISIMATPYALLSTLLPVSYSHALQFLLILFLIATACLLAVFAFKDRNLPIHTRTFTITLAIIFPLITAPHTLIYDLLILVPALILLTRIEAITQEIKLMAVIFYISLLLLPILGYVLKLALLALIPLTLFLYLLHLYFRTNIIAEAS